MRTSDLPILLVALTAGCKDSTAPVAPLTVVVTSAATIAGTRSTVDGAPRVTCSFAITASASGGHPGEYALWADGEAFYTLNTGVTSTLLLTHTDLIDWFGSDRISPLSPLTANRIAYWSGPFTLAITLRHIMPTLETRSSTFFLHCQ
jgi:hypothetical protein